MYITCNASHDLNCILTIELTKSPGLLKSLSLALSALHFAKMHDRLELCGVSF